MTNETMLYTTRREDAFGHRARRIPVRETWNPQLERCLPVSDGDIPPALAVLAYPARGHDRDDRYQARCLRILLDAQGGLPRHPVRPCASVCAVLDRHLPDRLAARTDREALRARRHLARLKMYLAESPELLDLLDSFDADGSGRFDFAGVAARWGVDLATAYRWRQRLAVAAWEVRP